MKKYTDSLLIFVFSAIFSALVVGACSKKDDDDAEEETHPDAISALTINLGASCEGKPCL